MRVVSYPERAVPLDLRKQVVALQDLAWPPDEPSGPEPWHDDRLDPVSVLLLDDDDRVLSALDILSKDIEHAGSTYAASGISAMVTDPRVRGQGYGRTLCRAARDMMQRAEVDLGIFTCDAHLQGFYERAGWTHLPGSVLVGGTPDEPLPSDTLGKVVLASFFSARAKERQAGFIATTIELYPGEIDRLW
jgi:aminoglycoside 2'-N-acetyltransferase I